MRNEWKAYVAMLCPVAVLEEASRTASQMSGNQADATVHFFSRPVGLMTGGVVTHYLAHSRIREVVLSVLPSLGESFPGSDWIVTDHDDNPSLVSKMTIEEWLESKGLRLLDPEEIVLDTNLELRLKLGVEL